MLVMIRPLTGFCLLNIAPVDPAKKKKALEKKLKQIDELKVCWMLCIF